MILMKTGDAQQCLKDSLIVREKVFIEEQGVAPEIEKDEYDKSAYFAMIYHEQHPIATGRIIKKNNEVLIGRVAVLKEYRGQQHGERIMKMLHFEGFNRGAEEINIHAQLHAEKFYEKFGYVRNSEVYLEAGIEHISMVLTKATYNKIGYEPKNN